MALDPSHSPSPSPSPSHADSPTGHCLGRFDFVLPSRLAPTGREQRIYLVKAWAEPTAAGGDGGWSRRMAEIERAAVGPVTQFSLASLGSAVWYQPSAQYPDERRLFFMRPQTGHALFLEAQASSGREKVAEQVVSRIAAGYQAAVASGFCLGPGSLVIAPSRNERAQASFGGGGVELAITMETVAAPDDGAATRGGAEGIQVLSQGRRPIAGLDGAEERVSMAPDGDAKGGAKRVYTWVYPGQPGDGLRPRIRLKATAGEGSRAALDSAWSALTQSLHQRPLGLR